MNQNIIDFLGNLTPTKDQEASGIAATMFANPQFGNDNDFEFDSETLIKDAMMSWAYGNTDNPDQEFDEKLFALVGASYVSAMAIANQWTLTNYFDYDDDTCVTDDTYGQYDYDHISGSGSGRLICCSALWHTLKPVFEFPVQNEDEFKEILLKTAKSQDFLNNLKKITTLEV